MQPYSKPQRIAIGVGVLAGGAALAILLQEPVVTGHWRLEHFLLPAIVAIAIATAHLTIEALREWRPISAAGFAFVFLIATALTVYSSVGNQKENSGEKAGAAEVHNQLIADKAKALRGEETTRDITTRLLEDTRAQLKRDCVDGKKGKAHCDGVRTNIGVYEAAMGGHEAVISRYQTELAKLGGRHVARPKVEAVGQAAAVLGWDRSKVEMLAETLEPFAFSLLFELCSIVAFGYGFHRPKAKKAKVDGSGTVAVTVPEPETVNPAVEALRTARKPLSNDELAALLDVSKAQASRLVARAADQIRKERAGRKVQLSLR